MPIYCFKHPHKKVDYRWNSNSGVLSINDKVVRLDRSANLGNLFYRLLEFKEVSSDGLTGKQEWENSIAVRKVLKFLNDKLDVEPHVFIQNERGYGYRWMVPVQKFEKDGIVPQPVGNHPLAEHLLDHAYLWEGTRDFEGRHFIFSALDQFRAEHDRGYFIILGDPGIGKTAFMAKLTQKEDPISHFNNAAEGVVSAQRCFEHLCAQLIIRYGLEYDTLPAYRDDSTFFKRILTEATEKLGTDDQITILIDALDEAEPSHSETNALMLPQDLPSQVFVVLSSRNTKRVRLRFTAPQRFFSIIHNSPENKNDVRLLLDSRLENPSLVDYLEKQAMDRMEFKRKLVDLSEGNFMYLRHVLPELERGAYKNLAIDKLPHGLQAYYEDHWLRMEKMDSKGWVRVKLRVLYALTAIYEPVNLPKLARFADVENLGDILDFIEDWRQFLHVKEHEDLDQKTYRIYHTSYLEFVRKQDRIELTRIQREVEGVTLENTHERIADLCLEQLEKDGLFDPND